MAYNPFAKRKEFFSHNEQDRIVNAIRLAEQQTSGEIRVYTESRCRFVDPLDRAAEVFWGLKMDMTKDRNGVLIYVAMKDRQFAILADQGIHEKVGQAFWNQEVSVMQKHFGNALPAEAIEAVVNDVGEALRTHFPYDRSTDKNELPDDLVFGK
ncbi:MULTISPECIES: TPM domain-containing protein [Niastella]|uniref:TPM domain-containing protein n=1 Tax=Niastella soli TaxID=2821487 RepID=A0ABS3YLB7_9BACT|nr:TPM domain-containing protein [Niastella soli]MBO9198628.1 TPM domain-containing protein [Niastella soli]